MLAPRPTPQLQDHPLSAVRDCLFNIFAATLHTGGRSSIRNLRTRRAVVTGSHLSRHTQVMLTLTAYLLQQWLQERASLLRCLCCCSTRPRPFLQPRTRTCIAVTTDHKRRLAEALNLQGEMKTAQFGFVAPLSNHCAACSVILWTELCC